ncbi:MAG: ATP-binding cassette domain-containing protein [Tannerellaceae bacterium]|nr:ATP-binding cassette domain-containing protein [Tannerellaceae bacterium]
MMLKLSHIKGGYIPGDAILRGVDLIVHKGESVGIVGLNGCGKSTLAKAIMNHLVYREGTVHLKDTDITKVPAWQLSKSGLSLFMQGGQIFDELSVWDNLLLVTTNKKQINEIQNYFIILDNSVNQLKRLRADRLSGGERHQLALAMCLLRNPSLLILDEPSAGLSPQAVVQLYELFEELKRKENLSILLIEQNIRQAVGFCDRIYLMEQGRLTGEFEKGEIEKIEEKMFN